MRFLVLMLTGRCSLACSYCYAQAGPNGADMDYDIAREAIAWFQRPGHPLVVELAGGEPLLAFGLIRRLLKTHSKLPELRFALQTNGLLLDEEKLGVLADKGVGLGLSLDGPPEVNDLSRGAGRRALHALDLLDRAGVGVNITVVLSKHNVSELPKFLLLLAGHPSVRVVNLDLVRLLGRAEGRDLSPSPEQLEAMVPRLLETLAFINARRWPPLKVREVDQVKRRGQDKTVQPYCLACRGDYAAVTPQGEVYPCSSLIDRPDFQAAGLAEGKPGDLRPMVTEWGLPEECAGCEARFMCRGCCPARRIAATGSVRQKCILECTLRKTLYREMTS